MDYKTVRYGSIEVYYHSELDGGGMKFGQDYVRLVRERFGHVGTVFEWCCGPAFIGFSLLGHGLCNRLCLADINSAAVEACRTTIARNGLEEVATVYLSDCLDSVPRDEMFDLVVGNPPHSPTAEVIPNYGETIIYQDVNWDIHKRFYASVGSHLSPGAPVIIQENGVVSKPADFKEMVADGKLRWVDCFPIPNTNQKYYVWSEA